MTLDELRSALSEASLSDDNHEKALAILDRAQAAGEFSAQDQEDLNAIIDDEVAMKQDLAGSYEDVAAVYQTIVEGIDDVIVEDI